MNNEKEQMLDLCFEIEGLLSMMLKRENDVPQRVESLLKQKVATLNEMCGAYSATGDGEEAIARSAEIEEADEADESAMVEEPVEDTTEEQCQDDACIQDEDTTEPSTDNCNAAAGAPLVLTLNDKFRFRRELFGNNAAELSDALDVVNAVSSKAELDDYFYNDLCWDPENPEVKDFMALASARFNN